MWGLEKKGCAGDVRAIGIRVRKRKKCEPKEKERNLSHSLGKKCQ